MVAGLAVIAMLAAAGAGFLASGFGLAAALASGFLAGSGLPVAIVARRLQAHRSEGRLAGAPVPVRR